MAAIQNICRTHSAFTQRTMASMASLSIYYLKNDSLKEKKKNQIPKAPVAFYLFNLRQEMNRKKPNPDGLLKAKYDLTCRLLWPTPKLNIIESKATMPKVIIYKYKMQRKMTESTKVLKSKMESKVDKKTKVLQKRMITKWTDVMIL